MRPCVLVLEANSTLVVENDVINNSNLIGVPTDPMLETQILHQFIQRIRCRDHCDF